MSRVLSALIFAATVGLSNSPCQTADEPKAEEPQPLPKEIIDAWKKVGCTTNWSQVSASGSREFHPLEKMPRAGWLPNLSFGKRDWKAEKLKDLPAPEMAFSLNLGLTTVKDEDLKEVATLKHLTGLMLDQTGVTDAGLKELTEHKQLAVLYLNGTQVTDAGLKELIKLKQLTILSLVGTKVTESGVKELQKALPNCTIVTKVRG
jgi:hypothetical protein